MASGDFIVPEESGERIGVYTFVVPSGKNVLEDIYTFCLKCSRGVRVLSATGGLTRFAIERQQSDGSVIVDDYKGHYMISGLTGVFLPNPNPVEGSREIITRGLNIRAHCSSSSSPICGVISDTITVSLKVTLTVNIFKVDVQKLRERLDQVGKEALLDEVPILRL